MSKYHKINSIFKRDENNKFIYGDWALPEFEYLAENKWIFTEKVDGMNIRVIIKDEKITFCGRSDDAQIPDQLLNRLIERFSPQMHNVIDSFPYGAVFYGEGYGAGIQKGGNYRKDKDFVLFDVRVGDYWLRRPDVVSIADKFGLDVVPVMHVGTLREAIKHAQNGIKSTWGDFEAEGYVARPKIELQTRGGQRVITKIKCCDFK